MIRTLTVFLLSLVCYRPLVAARPVVIAEEVVARFSAANNGAGPLWCYGSPLIVRDDTGVYVSIIETGMDVPPLCNTRWQLWKRLPSGWQAILQESDYRQREPCPIVTLPGAGLFLSSNPSTQPAGKRYGQCKPTVFAISGEPLEARLESPSWSEVANFSDHSYRGFAADGARRELLLLNIDSKTSEQLVSFRNAQGRWQPRGKITFPIRSAYPQVALREGVAHVMAIGDIREPNQQWQRLKSEVLKRQWDYVFRRLFYTLAPDIARHGFQPPIEIDSVESTAGHITNLDMHVDPFGAAHLLYLKMPYQYAFMRDKYFPGEAMTTSLEYVVIDQGRIVSRRTLAKTPDDGHGLEPSYARFHVATDEKLIVIIAGTQSKRGQPKRKVNVLQGIVPPDVRQEIELGHPFERFFTSTPRGGCVPCSAIDLFGTADDVPNLRYAAVQLNEE